MASAGIRDLKNNLSRYLRRLKAGEVIAVTDRGEVVAELRAAGPAPAGASPLGARYDQLVATGAIRPARQEGDPLADWPAARRGLPRGTAAALIDEDRGG